VFCFIGSRFCPLWQRKATLVQVEQHCISKIACFLMLAGLFSTLSLRDINLNLMICTFCIVNFDYRLVVFEMVLGAPFDFSKLTVDFFIPNTHFYFYL